MNTVHLPAVYDSLQSTTFAATHIWCLAILPLYFLCKVSYSDAVPFLTCTAESYSYF